MIPMFTPQIVVTPTGPAVTHSSDFTLVSPSKPAAPGEILSLFATDLGPTVPEVDPGLPFPSNPTAAVNSPVTVTVNGKTADVLAAVGYPGSADGYQVNFRVPPDAARGSAIIQVSAAWVRARLSALPSNEPFTNTGRGKHEIDQDSTRGSRAIVFHRGWAAIRDFDLRRRRPASRGPGPGTSVSIGALSVSR